MGALPQTSVHAVEGALDRHVHVLLVYLAVGPCVFWVAQARAVIAPSSIAAVVGARLHAAVLATPPRLAPARSVEAKAIICAVSYTRWD